MTEDVMIDYCRGSTPCGLVAVMDAGGVPLPLVAVIDAPQSAWVSGETAPWETLIYFRDAAGAKSAYRLARWLVSGDLGASLRIGGWIGVVVGHEHRDRPCWRRIAQAAPALIQPMPDESCVMSVEWEGVQ